MRDWQGGKHSEAQRKANSLGRIAGQRRGTPFRILVDEQEIIAYPGETIAAAIWAAGRRGFRWTRKTQESRGMFCGIGVCHECVMTVDGRPNVRTCLEPARPGAQIVSQAGLPPAPLGREKPSL